MMDHTNKQFEFNKSLQDVVRLFLMYFTLTLLCFLLFGSVSKVMAQTVSPVVEFADGGIDDQDDICLWVHPTPSQSLVIASDKGANTIFVYDLQGNTLQSIQTDGQPGNIDVRYNFLLDGELVDIVAFNDRSNSEVDIYRVLPDDRQLAFLNSFDGGNWPDELYGFCLYHSQATGKFYAIGAGASGQLRQWEMVDNGSGGINGIEMRTWSNGSQTEGMVADDENGLLFAANEVEGVYRYDAEPDDANPDGVLIAETGRNGLTDDVEGVTIYYAAGGTGYLIVSSQGNDSFKVYNRRPPHAFVKSFTVSGAGSTDGIDVSNLNFGGDFSQGIFLLHDGGSSPYVVHGCDYADLGLDIDTDYWNPRNTATAILPSTGIPEKFGLLQNYPNPFNPSTAIRYNLNEAEQVTLRIFDLLGREVSTLVDAKQPAGAYLVRWEAKNAYGNELPGGIYFAQLQAGSNLQTIKMALMR